MSGIKLSLPRIQMTKPPRVVEPKAPPASRAVEVAAIERPIGRFHPFNQKTPSIHWSGK